MTLRCAHLRFAAVALAVATVALAAPAAHAFNFQTLETPNGNGQRLSDPDDVVKNQATTSNGTYMPFGPNGPSVQFGTQTPNAFNPKPFGAPRVWTPPTFNFGNDGN